jgi:hypothetical protein
MYTTNFAETVMFRNLGKELVNVSCRSQLNDRAGIFVSVIESDTHGI